MVNTSKKPVSECKIDADDKLDDTLLFIIHYIFMSFSPCRNNFLFSNQF